MHTINNKNNYLYQTPFMCRYLYYVIRNCLIRKNNNKCTLQCFAKIVFWNNARDYFYNMRNLLFCLNNVTPELPYTQTADRLNLPLLYGGTSKAIVFHFHRCDVCV